MKIIRVFIFILVLSFSIINMYNAFSNPKLTTTEVILKTLGVNYE